MRNLCLVGVLRGITKVDINASVSQDVDITIDGASDEVAWHDKLDLCINWRGREEALILSFAARGRSGRSWNQAYSMEGNACCLQRRNRQAICCSGFR